MKGRLLDDLPVSKVVEVEAALLKHMHDEHPEIVKELDEKKELPPVAEKLREIIKNFKPRFTGSDEEAAGGES